MNTQTNNLPPADRPVDVVQFPETAKFMDWYRAQQANGLQDIKFFPGNVSGSTLESFFAEVNEALNADSVPDNRTL